MLSYKAYLSAIIISLATSLPVFSFDLSLGDDEQSLGIKITHDADEPFGKPLPWGPSSIRFSGTSLWAADTLKNRIVEYSDKGEYKNSIPLKIPSISTIGDFCFGYYGKTKEKALFVCDADNPIIYVFNPSGDIISQIGTEEKSIFSYPKRIEYSNEKIYVLDTSSKEIFILNNDLSFIKKIKTASENFTIENNILFHIANIGRNKIFQWINLTNGEVHELKPGVPAETEIDYISTQNKDVIFGVVKFEENSDKAQYLLIKTNKDEKISKLFTDYPTSFITRSFIKNKEGKIFQIKFDENQPNKIIIDSLPDDFIASEG